MDSVRFSEGPARQVRRLMLDRPFRFRERDRQAPPSLFVTSFTNMRHTRLDPSR